MTSTPGTTTTPLSSGSSAPSSASSAPAPSGAGAGPAAGPDGLATGFLDAAMALLARVRAEEAGTIAAAGTLLAETAASGGRLFAFGAGHSALPAQDLVYRAGGLALMNLLAGPGLVGVDVRPATLGSALERVEGYATAVLDSSPLRAGDALVIISLSGRNALPVELAQAARARGVRVIGVTSVAYAEGTTARNPSGTFLKDHCDVVLDNKIAVGDAELSVEGIGAPFAPASTVVTSAVLQAVMASAAGALLERGVEPPMLRSGNVDGGHDWNAEVFATYRDRIFYQH